MLIEESFCKYQNIPTFHYNESSFQQLFQGLGDDVSKKQKDMIVYHFINFMSKDIQKQLNRMVKMYKKFQEES